MGATTTRFLSVTLLMESGVKSRGWAIGSLTMQRPRRCAFSQPIDTIRKSSPEASEPRDGGTSPCTPRMLGLDPASLTPCRQQSIERYGRQGRSHEQYSIRINDRG